MWILIAGAFVAGAVVASAGWAIGLSSSQTKTSSHTHHDAGKSSPAPKPSATPDAISTGTPAADCPSSTVKVSSAISLASALRSAKPGTVIQLAAGSYSGQFEATTSGTSSNPIWLCGPSDAVLNGGDISKGYTFHLDAVNYWNLDGFSVRGGQKGVMADNSNNNVIEHLTVSGIGDEAIHLRDNSTHNTVSANTVSNTGLLKAKFGEGIYIGTSVNNWASVMGSSSTPDRSDDNVIEGNTISNTTAENVDIKEGTTGGRLLDNSFNGVGMDQSGADSWVDVKGNNWTISGNHGVTSVNDGFQTHQILNGWGTNNVFSNNTADVNGPGFGFHLTPALANVVECNNKVSGAAKGLSNIKCSAG